MSKSKNPICGVYCYYRGETPLYVGRSIDIHRRRLEHKNNNRFVGCDFVLLEYEVPPEELKDREYYYIETLYPEENMVVRNNMEIKEVRDRHIEHMKTDNPMKKGMTNRGSFHKGQKPIITPERNKKISEGMKGENNPNYGKSSSSSHLNKNKLTCPVCGIVTTKGNYNRWGHGTTCKKKP